MDCIQVAVLSPHQVYFRLEVVTNLQQSQPFPGGAGLDGAGVAGHHCGGAPPSLAHDVGGGHAVGGHAHRHADSSTVAGVVALEAGVGGRRGDAPGELGSAQTAEYQLLIVAILRPDGIEGGHRAGRGVDHGAGACGVGLGATYGDAPRSIGRANAVALGADKRESFVADYGGA